VATKLDRETIVETALLLLNEEGLEGLTLRRLAKDLNVQAPALYWHFGSKQALLDGMATQMLHGMLDPIAEQATAGTPWQDLIADLCRGTRRTLLGYRDGAKVFSGTHLTDDQHRAPMQTILGAFVDQGFDPTAAFNAFFTAYSFTIGFVIEEQAAERDPRYAEEGWWGEVGDFDERFEIGLRIAVAGTEATLARPR
jgi:AcrR family transcriptional regulator